MDGLSLSEKGEEGKKETKSRNVASLSFLSLPFLSPVQHFLVLF